jgi:signal transduction histidine kinase/ligand-binding sensor domain-containing protein
MPSILRTLLLFAVLAVALRVHAQSPEPRLAPGTAPLRFERLSVEHGLSQGSIYSMIQDRHGFMWFGTQSGIDRYDGYRFTSFEKVAFDTTTYFGNYANGLYEDASGDIWVITVGGVLQRFDPTTGRFARIPAQAWYGEPSAPPAAAMIGDGGDGIWLATSRGLVHYTTSTERSRVFWHDATRPESLPSDGVTWLHRDDDDYLWVATANGLARTRDGSSFERFLGGPSDGERPGFMSHILARPEQPGILWVSSQAGLIRFDTRDGSSRRFLPDPLDPAANQVLMAAPDPVEESVLWLTTGDRGLLRFDEKTGRFESYRHNPRDPFSLAGDNVHAIHTDRSGIIWVGDFLARGLSKFDPTVNSIRQYRAIPDEPNSLGNAIVFSIVEDDDEVFWFGTMHGGVSRFDRRRNEYRHYRHDPRNANSITSDYVRSILKDRAGRLWIGTAEGLNRLDPKTDRITRFRHDPANPRSLGANFVRRIYEDRDGTIWVGALGTLNRFDPATESFTVYRQVPGDPNSLPGNSLVISFLEDQAGTLWIGINGLARMDRLNGTFESFRHLPDNPQSPAGNAIWTIHERKKEPGVLWLASYDGALTRFDTRDHTFRHFSMKDGLANDVLYGLVEDDHGQFWMSTNRGIARFDPETETFRNYDVDSGLQGLEFNAGAYLKSRSGEIFFGGVNGVNSFYPENLRDNPNPPQIVLTGIKLFNRPLTVGGDSPLKQPLTRTSEVRLRHDQNMLTFEFAALHFRNPARNRYAYMLEGLDQDWIDAGDQRVASYANLAPGSYTFRVRAANSDGVWNEEGASVRLVVLPPWWRTWWAYAFYFLVFCVGLFAVDRFQRRRLITTERERIRERELEHARQIEHAYHELEEAHGRLKATQAQLVQQEKLASLGALTAGIAHEIKNPLNFINNFSDVSAEMIDELQAEITRLEDRLSEDETREVGAILRDLRLNLTKISEHGRRADSIVRSMLEHSRTGGGDRQPTDMNRLVDEFVNLAYHGMRAREKDFTCSVQKTLDPMLPPVAVVPQDVGRVLLNLLANAFDAVGARRQEMGDGFAPAVTVETAATGEGVVVRIRDNGGGIPEHVRRRIFEPFFTTKASGQGTGLGLSLSHDIIVAGHGGSLTAENHGGGACFTLVLPVERAGVGAQFTESVR